MAWNVSIVIAVQRIFARVPAAAKRDMDTFVSMTMTTAILAAGLMQKLSRNFHGWPAK